MAFSSSSLRLRFIFLSLASLMTSFSPFLALPFLSLLFYFCLGLGFCQPYHHLPLTMQSSSISAKLPTRLIHSFHYWMLFIPIFAVSGCRITTTRRDPGFTTLGSRDIAQLVLFSSGDHIIKFAAFTIFVSHTLHLLSSTT
jgi:hypothetical protein